MVASRRGESTLNEYVLGQKGNILRTHLKKEAAKTCFCLIRCKGANGSGCVNKVVLKTDGERTDTVVL